MPVASNPILRESGPCLFMVFLLLVLVGCHPRPKVKTAIPPTMGDSIALVSVEQSRGNRLERGKPADLLVTLKYTLATRDRAVLVLELDQFSTNQTCTISEPANTQEGEREIVGTQVTPIESGTRTLQLRITWPGGQPTNGKPFQSGALSFQASMRTDQPEYSFLTYRFGTQYCMQF
jgi:hypothetical protein